MWQQLICGFVACCIHLPDMGIWEELFDTFTRVLQREYHFVLICSWHNVGTVGTVHISVGHRQACMKPFHCRKQFLYLHRESVSAAALYLNGNTPVSSSAHLLP